jgi:hypothetical protein
MSKMDGGRISVCGALTAGNARIPGMGAISIFTSRLLSLYIDKDGKVFNLLASFLSDFRTLRSKLSASDGIIPAPQSPRLRREFRMLR